MSKPWVYDNFDLFGTQIENLQQWVFQVSQKYYISNLNHIPSDTSFEQFRSYRALFSWIGHARPDLLVRDKKMAQVTKQSFSDQTVWNYNTAVNIAKRNLSQGLVYCFLDKATVHIMCYADALFASNDNLSSQVGFIIML